MDSANFLLKMRASRFHDQIREVIDSAKSYTTKKEKVLLSKKKEKKFLTAKKRAPPKKTLRMTATETSGKSNKALQKKKVTK